MLKILKNCKPVVGISSADLIGLAAQDLGDGARNSVVHGVQLHLPLAVGPHGRVRKWVEKVGVAECFRQLRRGTDEGGTEQTKNHLVEMLLNPFFSFERLCEEQTL
jgi:hypothetical protein